MHSVISCHSFSIGNGQCQEEKIHDSVNLRTSWAMSVLRQLDEIFTVVKLHLSYSPVGARF